MPSKHIRANIPLKLGVSTLAKEDMTARNAPIAIIGLTPYWSANAPPGMAVKVDTKVGATKISVN